MIEETIVRTQSSKISSNPNRGLLSKPIIHITLYLLAVRFRSLLIFLTKL